MDPKSQPTTSSGAQPKKQGSAAKLEDKAAVLNQLVVSSGAPVEGLFQGNFDYS